MSAWLASLAVAAVPALVAPWAEPPSVEPRWILDGGAKKSAAPKRIVTLAPSVTEFTFALGAGSRVVGVSRFDDFPPEVKDLPAVGGFLDPNIEVIVGLRPDLVIAVPNAGVRPSLERIAGLGVPVLVVPGNSFSDAFHACRAIAGALGGDAPERCERILQAIRLEVAALQKGLVGKKPARVAFVYDQTPLILAGPGSFADTMLRVLGAKNVVQVDAAYPPYSMEQLLADAPEVILDANVAMTSTAAAQFWMRWTALPAVKNKRVHTLDATSLVRAGPRIAEALRTIAKLL